MSGLDFGLFANDLYHQTVPIVPEGNLIISPICIQTVLTLAYIAAVGQTANEMKKCLRLQSFDQNEVGNYYDTALKKITENNILIANKIYVQNNFPVLTSYREKAEKYFQSEVDNIDFTNNANAAKEISDWVAQKTNNTVLNFLDASKVQPNTDIILVNTIHVSALWHKQFRPDLTEKQVFYLNDRDTTQVDMMSTSSHIRYGVLKSLNAKAIAMPCRNSDINFLVILPNQPNGLQELEAKLSEVILTDIGKYMENTMVSVKLPKFKFETFIDMGAALRNMGMVQMFTPAADFSGITGSSGLAIANVYHKAVIDVNEAGLEASAATSVQMLRLAVMRLEQFTANHPFWFAVRHGETILFTGRFTGP